MTSRYIGSGRAKEGGELATRVQDFKAHYSGGDFKHDASHILMNPALSNFPGANVQAVLEALDSIGGFITIGDVDGYSHGIFNVDSSLGVTFKDAFEQAIASTELQDGGTVFILPGTYTVTATISVPAGISIKGDLGGVYINKTSTDSSIFKVLATTKSVKIGGDSGSGEINVSTGSNIEKTIISNISLFDNKTGTSPNVTSYGLVSIEAGSNAELINVGFFGRLANTATPQSKTKYAVSTTSGTSNGTTLAVINCFIDGVETGIYYHPNNGNLDYLRVEGCKARTYGTQTSLTPSRDCFINSTVCFTDIVNNFYIGAGAYSYYFIYFDSSSGTTSDLRFNISNNFGNAASVANYFIYNNSGITLNGNISGNNFGIANESSWFITVGGADGYTNYGDINGPDAIDTVLLWAYNSDMDTTIVVNPGTYTVNLQSLASRNVSKIKLIGNKKGKNYPILELDISSTTTDDLGQRSFTLGNHIESIYFRSVNRFQSVRPGFNPTSTTANTSAHTLTIKDCFFLNTSLFIREIGSLTDNLGKVSKTNIVIEDCQFFQDGTFNDSISLVCPSAHNIDINNCNFYGYGYALLCGKEISAYLADPALTSVINITNTVFDLSGYSIDNESALNGSYIEIKDGTSFINLKNSIIKSSASTINTDLLDDVGPAQILYFTFFDGRVVNIDGCTITGPNQKFKSGSSWYSLANVSVKLEESVTVQNCIFNGGGTALQIGGEEGSINYDYNGSICVKNCQFVPVSGCVSICQLSIDYEDNNLYKNSVIIDSCNFVFNNAGVATNIASVSYPPFLNAVNGVNYDSLGVVQVYVRDTDIVFTNNTMLGQTEVTDGYGTFANVCGVVLNNFVNSFSTSTIPVTTTVSNNNIAILNTFTTATSTDAAACVYIYGNNAIVTNNHLQCNNQASIDSNFIGCLLLDTRVINNSGSAIVTGNYLSRTNFAGTNTSLSGGYIKIPSACNTSGKIVNNTFNHHTYNGSSTTTLYKLNTVPWEFHTNKNQTVKTIVHGDVGYKEVSSGTSYIVQDANADIGDPSLDVTLTTGGTRTFTWHIPLCSFMPPGAYVTEVVVGASADQAGTQITTDTFTINLVGANGGLVTDNTSIDFSPNGYVANDLMEATLTPTSTDSTNTFMYLLYDIYFQPKLSILITDFVCATNTVVNFKPIQIDFRW